MATNLDKKTEHTLSENRLHDQSPTNYRKPALVALFGVIVLFFNLGGYRSFSSHEGLAVVPAQGMLESGNYVVPHYAGVPRLKKPPLVYWVNSVSAKMFGGLSEWSARAPQALSALLLAWLIGHWATQWYGRNVGLVAAVVQLTCVYVIDFGRKAEIDMLLCLLTTAALYLVATSDPKATWKASFGRITAIYALLSCSWLAKFYYGPVMVIAPTVVYFIIQKRYSDFAKMLNPVGIVLAAAAIFIWPYLVLQQVPEAWAIWERETVGRARGDLGNGPFWYYVPHFLGLMLPWSLFVIGAWPHSWKRAWKEADPRERFLWVWFIVQLLIISSQASKHKHYLMSMLPLFSMMAATQLVRLQQRLPKVKGSLSRLRVRSLATVAISFSMATALFIMLKWPWLQVSAILMGLTLATGFIASLVYFQRAQMRASLVSFAIMALTCHMISNTTVIPGQDHRTPAAHFAQKMRTELGPQPEIITYNMGEWDSFLFYLGDEVKRMESFQAISKHIEQNPSTNMLAYEPDLIEIEKFAHIKMYSKLVSTGDGPSPKHAPLVWVELSPLELTTTEVNEQSLSAR